ncbi:hypothetical protein C8R43DRAFT_198169 [Mycena crocata]|nr:hypothetical protein C8R43DRAFT_198169 [Mycena crocata]
MFNLLCFLTFVVFSAISSNRCSVFMEYFQSTVATLPSGYMFQIMLALCCYLFQIVTNLRDSL